MRKIAWTRAIWMALVVTYFTINVNALFPEQEGRYDWHLKHIGQVTGAIFLEEDTIGVITEKNILAALNISHGEIIWRKLLDSPAQGLKKSGSTLYTLQENGGIKGWDSKRGSFLGEHQGGDILDEDGTVESKVTDVVLNVLGKKDVHKVWSSSTQSLASLGDHSLAYIKGEKLIWLREEALASPVGTLLVDFPDIKNLKDNPSQKQNAFFMNLKTELHFQMLNLQVNLLKAASPEEMVELESLKQNRKMAPNEFHKLVIVLTTMGKIFALHSGDGSVYWSTNLLGNKKCGTFVDMWVYKQQENFNTIAILSECSSEKKYSLTFINSNTGDILSSTEGQSDSFHLVKLQPTGPNYLQKALLVDLNKKVAHVLAEDSGVASKSTLDIQPTYFYHIDDNGHTVSGYNVLPSGGVVQLWSVELPEKQRIVSSASPDYFQKVYSRTRVLGDRSALYKYVNPNIMFFAAESLDAGNEKLSIYLIDTVTGRMLYRIVHKSAQGPVYAVFHDNWVVYQYWNVRGSRSEISVLELYEDEPMRNSKTISSHIYDSIRGFNQSDSISSFEPSAVRVLGQSYIFGTGVKAMAVTRSSLGITSNQVLVATIADQVYAIDKKMLDPRRPITPTNADKEEGLIPYKEYLPIVPQKFPSYTHQILGLEHISCYPTLRESNILMVAYGIDFFYTRMMPSKSFDMLEDDFSYSLLSSTILGLLVAAISLYFMVQRDNVKRNWV